MPFTVVVVVGSKSNANLFRYVFCSREFHGVIVLRVSIKSPRTQLDKIYDPEWAWSIGDSTANSSSRSR